MVLADWCQDVCHAALIVSLSACGVVHVVCCNTLRKMCETYQTRSLHFHLAGPLLTTSLTSNLDGHVKGVGQQRSCELGTQALHLLGLTYLF